VANKESAPASHSPAALLTGLAVLLLFQCLGEFLEEWAHLPIPGPVIGMVLLFLAMCWKGRAPHSVQGMSRLLLANLSLLFVPAAVGAFLHSQQIVQDGIPLLLGILISTLLTLGVSAWLLQKLSRFEVKK